MQNEVKRTLLDVVALVASDATTEEKREAIAGMFEPEEEEAFDEPAGIMVLGEVHRNLVTDLSMLASNVQLLLSDLESRENTLTQVRFWKVFLRETLGDLRRAQFALDEGVTWCP